MRPQLRRLFFGFFIAATACVASASPIFASGFNF